VVMVDRRNVSCQTRDYDDDDINMLGGVNMRKAQIKIEKHEKKKCIFN